MFIDWDLILVDVPSYIDFVKPFDDYNFFSLFTDFYGDYINLSLVDNLIENLPPTFLGFYAG